MCSARERSCKLYERGAVKDLGCKEVLQGFRVSGFRAQGLGIVISFSVLGS